MDLSYFCSLLNQAEKCEIFNLLLEYSRSLDKLAFFINRAEEYKLILLLTCKDTSSFIQKKKHTFYTSLLIGGLFGIISGVLVGYNM
ncbi:hypothetical protein NEIG_02065 [Nematocida sp. ERTm5]|nr:hypothetical protein NEIG_02065 [Nematocida sp. ERTm5]